VRCPCGALLARTNDDEVEFKCRRCKRLTRVRLESMAGPAPLRCECGTLLASYADGGLRTKCRRCKRIERIA